MARAKDRVIIDEFSGDALAKQQGIIDAINNQVVDTSLLATEDTLQDLRSAIENQTIELSSGGTTLKPPTSVTAIAGTIGAGTVENAKYHDGSYLQGNEVAGQGLTLEFVYEIPTGKTIDSLQFHGRYEGGGTHYMAFQLFDYALNSWVSITDEENRVPNGTTDVLRNIPLNNPNFVSGTEAKVRIFHNVGTYFSTHRLYVDYIALQYQTSLEVAVDTTGLATEAKQDDLITAVNAISGTTPYNYIQKDAGATYTYYGYASSTGWRIKRKTNASGIWQVASGSGDYDTNWSTRSAKTYLYI